MPQWIKARVKIIASTFRHPALLAGFGLLQALYFILGPYTPLQLMVHLPKILAQVSWDEWFIGWLAVLWLASIEYSVVRKREFDKTSLNFFKAFLDFLIKQGHHLYEYSGEKDFYSKINDWQHQVIQGIAIGLGPAESEKYFQKMDNRHSVTKAYKEAQSSGSAEPLCRWLDGHLKELEEMRANLREKAESGTADLEAPKDMKRIGGSSR